jgi:hypothetical protein
MPKHTTIWALNPIFDINEAGATTAIGEHSFSVVGVEDWSHYDIFSHCAVTSREQKTMVTLKCSRKIWLLLAHDNDG